MGDRATLQIKFGDRGSIYLYTHWNGSEMPTRLQNALKAGRPRWGDAPYLARILISLIITDHSGETGHGLSPYAMDSEYPELIVDLQSQKVTMNGHTWSFEGYSAGSEQNILRYWQDTDDI